MDYRKKIFAELSGINRSILSKIENKQHKPSNISQIEKSS